MTTQRWSQKTLASQSIVRLTPSKPPGSSGRRPRETTSGSVTSAKRLDIAGREDHLEAPPRDGLVALDLGHDADPPVASLPPVIWCKCYSHEMTDDVKPKRAYRSTRRADQVAEKRRAILAAADACFRADGYGAVTMPLIAREAGVAVETIYRAFGSKAGLFAAVIDAAVAGGRPRAERPVEERPAIRAIIEEPDPRRQVELYAATQPGIHRRSGQLLRALAAAAGDGSRAADAVGRDRGEPARGAGAIRPDARRTGARYDRAFGRGRS